MKKLRLTLLRSKTKKNSHFSFVGMLIKSKIISAEEAPLPSSEGKDETVQSLFYFINVLGHRITWRDMLCMTPLKAGLSEAVRQLFSLIAVAASEIVTVISSNSSFISFWRSFRQIVWEVLWTLKLTQSQVGIVGLKIVNSLNGINRCVKFRKRNRLLVTFVVFFTALRTFWQLIL